MNKVNNEPMARKLAVENGECYGMSVFGGDWFTGTREQLERIGVTDVVDPKCIKGDAALGLAVKMLIETVQELGATHPYMRVKVSITPRGIGVGVNTHGGSGFHQLEDEYICNTTEAAFWVRVTGAVKDYAAQNPAPAQP